VAQGDVPGGNGEIGSPAQPGTDGDGSPTKVRDYEALGKIVFGLIVGWVALIAIPGSLPISSGDDAQRVIAVAALLATVLAIAMASIAWVRGGSLRKESTLIAAWSARVVIALAALQVVMVLLVPADWPYRMQALGVGLLVILGGALLAMSGRPAAGDGLFSGFRFSNVPLVTTVVAVVVIAGYLILVAGLFRAVPGSTNTTWVRYSDLRGGLESLAFAAAGALFGTAVQRQVTNAVQADLASSDAAADELNDELDNVVNDAESGRLVAVEPASVDTTMREALLEDHAAFAVDPQRLTRKARQMSAAIAVPPTATVTRIRNRQSRAALLRRRRP
jgi:hypothetical protein